MSVSDADIFARLDVAGQSLLGGFSSLTDAQRVAIPQILARRAVLLVSRTASGKTEAVLAPLLALLARERWAGAPCILYVAPTRALVNDLWERIASKTRGFVDVGRRTGEYRASGGSTLLLTTPESLDSMLARGWNGGDHVLANVRAVVLDELHLVAESARGTQLQVLLGRLDGRTKEPVLRIGLSATVPQPAALAARFLGSGAVVCSAPGSRNVEVDGLPAGRLPPKGDGVDPLVSHLLRFAVDLHDVQLAERLLDVRHEMAGQVMKSIVFVPSRARCDALAGVLGRVLHDRARIEVFAHHASLDKAHRERTEEQFKRRDLEAVVVATSTLEVGIDIGDISVVVLDGPPGSVGSLLQRVGRGNRRTDKVYVLATAHNRVQAATLASMLRSAIDGELDPVVEVAHYSVAIQQAASLLRQARKRLPRKTLIERLAAAFGDRSEWLVDQLVEAGLLDLLEGGAVRAGAVLTELMDAPMQLHANIGGGRGVLPLIDSVTGEALAWVSERPRDPSVMIAGVSYDVKNVGDSVELSGGVQGGAGSRVRYGAKAAPLTRNALRHLARGIGLSDRAVVHHDGEYLHFGGALFGKLLDLGGVDSGPLSSVRDPRLVGRSAARIGAAGWKALEKLCGFGPFQRQLPEVVREEAVRATVEASGFSVWLQEMELVEGLSEEQAEVLAEA